MLFSLIQIQCKRQNFDLSFFFHSFNVVMLISNRSFSIHVIVVAYRIHFVRNRSFASFSIHSSRSFRSLLSLLVCVFVWCCCFSLSYPHFVRSHSLPLRPSFVCFNIIRNQYMYMCVWFTNPTVRLKTQPIVCIVLSRLYIHIQRWSLKRGSCVCRLYLSSFLSIFLSLLYCSLRTYGIAIEYSHMNNTRTWFCLCRQFSLIDFFVRWSPTEILMFILIVADMSRYDEIPMNSM